MSDKNKLSSEIIELINTLNKVSSLSEEIEKVTSVITECIKSGKKIMICGNGGSAAEANHLAAEFLVRLKPDNNRAAIPIISLSQNSSVLTACGNDLGFENIFSRTLEGLGNSGDVLISLSTSGNSKNVLNAIIAAKNKKIKTVSFLGEKGGTAKNFSDMNILIPSENVARIQECHLFLGHYIFGEVEKKLF